MTCCRGQRPLEQFEEIVRSWLRGYGYRNVRTPVLEHTRLFARGIGEVTDIVERRCTPSPTRSTANR